MYKATARLDVGSRATLHAVNNKYTRPVIWEILDIRLIITPKVCHEIISDVALTEDVMTAWVRVLVKETKRQRGTPSFFVADNMIWMNYVDSFINEGFVDAQIEKDVNVQFSQSEFQSMRQKFLKTPQQGVATMDSRTIK